MKLEDIKALNLPHYKHDPNSVELTIGDSVAKAEISTIAEAWVWGYSRNGGNYHFSFQRGISQHEDPRFPCSRNKPKDFPVYVIGIVEEGKANKLAYATSRDHDTKKINTLRLTPLEQVIQISDYRLILKKD